MQHTSKYTVVLLTALASLASCSENDMPGLDKATDSYIVFGTPSLGLDGSEGDFAGDRNTRANATLLTSVDQFYVWAYNIPNKIKGEKDDERATEDWTTYKKYAYFTSGADVDNLKGALVTPSGANNYNNGKLTKWNENSDAKYTFIGLAGRKFSYNDPSKGDINNFDFSMANASAVSGSEVGPRLTISLNPYGEMETVTITVYDTVPGKPSWGNWNPDPVITARQEEVSRLKNVNRSYQPDPLVAAVYDRMHEGGKKVQFTFSHIMTALRFKVQNFSSSELTVTSLKLNGKFYKEAMVDFSSTTPKTSVDVSKTYDGPFIIIDDSEDIPGEDTKFAGGEDNYLLLLPNPAGVTNDSKNILGSDVKIEVEYQFTGGDKKTIEIPVKLNYMPDAGTKHTVFLNFVGGNVYVTFQANSWQNGSDNEYIIQ